MHSNYKESLKSPEWQKMRLEILNRDNFTCLHCGDTKEELHVHHTVYYPKLKPWQYLPSTLKTLCASCHRDESNLGRRNLESVYNRLKLCKLSSKELHHLSKICELKHEVVRSFLKENSK